MSAFIHEDKVFDSIARTFYKMHCSADHRIKHAAENIMEIIALSRTAPPELPFGSFERADWYINRFSEDLQRANVESVNYRYRENTPVGAYRCAQHKGKTLAPVELLKLLDSVDYQSCEVPNWTEAPIAKELHGIIHAIEAQVARSLPEYAKADWSMR